MSDEYGSPGLPLSTRKDRTEMGSLWYFGDPETVIGGTYRDRLGHKITFVVESEHKPIGHIAGELTAHGVTKRGLFRWAEFHRLFELAASGEAEE